MTSDAALDVSQYQSWIGRTQRVSDVVTERLARGFLATLDEPEAECLRTGVAPHGIHWCLAPALARNSTLRPDGHPLHSDLLPPIPLAQRMFAACRSELLQSLHVGDVVERVSTIEDIVQKDGRSGSLCFVTIAHSYSTPRGLAVRDVQDLVFRNPAQRPAKFQTARPEPMKPQPSAGHADGSEGAEWQCRFALSPVVLFRYSALTFNSHRIHYDKSYTVGVEGHAELLVHSPLLGTLLLRFAAFLRDGVVPRRFNFRSTAPMYETKEIVLCAKTSPNGMTLWALDAGGVCCIQADAAW
jgi:3-methylfumaryl-CoA hydratase